MAHAPVKGSLECVVVAIAQREIAPVNLLVLRPRSQGLGHCSREPRIRGSRKSSRRRCRVRHTVGEARPENARSQSEHAAGVHVVVYSGGAAAINQPRPVVTYISDIDRHVFGQLALERDRPVLIPGHGVSLGIHTYGVSAIRHVGPQLRREDDRACRPSAGNVLRCHLSRTRLGPVEIERRESPVGDIRRRRVGLVTVHRVGIPRVRLRAGIVHPVAPADDGFVLDLVGKAEAWTDIPTAVPNGLAAAKYRRAKMADRVSGGRIECGKLSMLLRQP